METDTDLQDHILLLGFGSEGMWVARPLRDAGHRVVVVDHDPAVIDYLERAEIACHRGDAVGEKDLQRAGFQKARLVLISLPNVEEALRILRYERPADLPVIVRVFEEAHARQIEKHGGIAILNSRAAADTFMEWFAEQELDAKKTPAG